MLPKGEEEEDLVTPKPAPELVRVSVSVSVEVPWKAFFKKAVTAPAPKPGLGWFRCGCLPNLL